MKRFKRVFHGLTFNIIMAVTVLLLVFCVVTSAIGYFKFTDALTKEYTDSALNTANTAAELVKNDNIDAYLENKQSILDNEDTPLVAEYLQTLGYLDILCNKQDVTVIYVIVVAEDYGSYTCVFNCPNLNSGYTPWEIGKVVTTSSTAGTYRQTYEDIYVNGAKSATVMRTTKLNGAQPHITSLIPLYKSDGTTVAGIMCVQRPMSELTEGRRSYIILIVCFTLGIAVLFILFFTLFMKRQFVNPIQKINAEAVRFAKENSAPDKPFLGKLSRINEISSLAAAISDMEKETLEYIDNLSAAISEKQRMGTELRIASLIQEGSVSSVFPAFPDRTEFDLFALMEPAKEVGGDFYDFFMTDDDHLALVIADVSGKGVPAALFMMATKILVNERAHVGGTPAEILNIVNTRICAQNKGEMFITVWLGILEISTGKLIFANAGHDDPAFALGGEFSIEKRKHGLAIGAFEGAQYKNTEITLSKGDKIFLYTDGVPEATDKNNKLFTAEKMIDALNSDKNGSPESIIKTVRRKAAEFTGDAPQFDDMTMLCCEYKGKNGKSIKLSAVDDNLEKTLDFIRECLKGSGCTEKFVRQVELYVEEIFVNIAHYAYAPDTGDVEISAEVLNDKIRVVFTDEGKRYNPLEKSDPDISLSADEREIGGLGIFMTKKLTDKIEYEYKDGKNILITEKNFG